MTGGNRSGPGRARPLAQVAIVGTRMWAPRLAAAAQRAGLTIVTCYCRGEERRTRFAEQFGCAAAGSLEEAIGHPDVEGVLLATPNDTHEEQALACAAQGPPRVRREADRGHARGGRAHARRLRGSGRGADGRARLPAARRRAPDPRADRGRRARRGRARRGQHVAAGPLPAGRLAGASARATPAGRSCSSASTTSTRSPTGSARSRVRTARSRMCTRTPTSTTSASVTLEFRSGALGVVTGSYVSPKTMSLRLFGSEGVLDYSDRLLGLARRRRRSTA